MHALQFWSTCISTIVDIFAAIGIGDILIYSAYPFHIIYDHELIKQINAHVLLIYSTNIRWFF